MTTPSGGRCDSEGMPKSIIRIQPEGYGNYHQSQITGLFLLHALDLGGACAGAPHLPNTRLRYAQSLLGFLGFKSQSCFTRARSRPAGENSAISGPLGPGICTLKMRAAISSRMVPLSMERKRPRTQFQPW